MGNHFVLLLYKISWYLDLVIGVVRIRGIRIGCLSLLYRKIRRENFQRKQNDQWAFILEQAYSRAKRSARMERLALERQVVNHHMDYLNDPPELFAPVTEWSSTAIRTGWRRFFVFDRALQSKGQS